MSAQVVDWFVMIGDGMVSELILSHVFSIAASWVLLFLLYALMPNTRVALRSAAIGSLVGSLLWEFAKFGFQIYVVEAVPYSAIYGSIGLIPLFLFWMYVTWVIVLFGLILTYTLQSLGGSSLIRMDRDKDSLPIGDPDWMLPIMSEVGHAFGSGYSIDNQTLAEQIGLSSRVVHDMTNKLVDASMLRKVNSGAGVESSLTLARPAEKIHIAEILELAHRVRPTSNHPAWKTLANLKQAERDAADNKTLADLNQVFQSD
jgi:membrane protein